MFSVREAVAESGVLRLPTIWQPLRIVRKPTSQGVATYTGVNIAAALIAGSFLVRPYMDGDWFWDIPVVTASLLAIAVWGTRRSKYGWLVFALVASSIFGKDLDLLGGDLALALFLLPLLTLTFLPSRGAVLWLTPFFLAHSAAAIGQGVIHAAGFRASGLTLNASRAAVLLAPPTAYLFASASTAWLAAPMTAALVLTQGRAGLFALTVCAVGIFARNRDRWPLIVVLAAIGVALLVGEVHLNRIPDLWRAFNLYFDRSPEPWPLPGGEWTTVRGLVLTVPYLLSLDAGNVLPGAMWVVLAGLVIRHDRLRTPAGWGFLAATIVGLGFEAEPWLETTGPLWFLWLGEICNREGIPDK